MLRKLYHLMSVLLLLFVVAGCSDAEIQAFVNSLSEEQKQELKDLIAENPDSVPPGIEIPEELQPELPTGGEPGEPEEPGDGDPNDPGDPEDPDDPFEFPDGDLDPNDPIVPIGPPTDPPGNEPIEPLADTFVPEPATAATALIAGLMLSLRGRRREER